MTNTAAILDQQSMPYPYTIPARAGADRSGLAAAVLAACKASILPHLATVNIAIVRVEYDGGGDEGQIGEITAFDSECQPLPLPGLCCERHQLQYNGATVVDLVGLDLALESFAESALEALHDGWENGEGAFGTLIIKVASNEVSLDHSSRFVSYDTTQHDL